MNQNHNETPRNPADDLEIPASVPTPEVFSEQPQLSPEGGGKSEPQEADIPQVVPPHPATEPTTTPNKITSEPPSAGPATDEVERQVEEILNKYRVGNIQDASALSEQINNLSA